MGPTRRTGRPLLNRRVARLADRFYQDPAAADADEAFFRWVEEELPANADVLEIGAGDGRAYAHRLRRMSRSVTGIDIDRAVLSNRSLTRALLCDFRSMPFADASFDAVVANNVVEHLDDPSALVVAAIRVLRRGGSLFLKTTNLEHYVGTAALLTPHAFHIAYNRRRGRPAEATHPTRYRMNTQSTVTRCARRAGLDAEVRMFEGRPEYLASNALLFLLGVLYERLVNSAPWLGRFRSVLMVRLTRKTGHEAQV